MQKREFRLNNESINRQLDIHFKNLFSYFNINNEHIRHFLDKESWSSVEDIIQEVQYLIRHKDKVKETLEIRHIHPQGFRIAQLIQHYGADVIASYVYINFEKMEQIYA